MKTKKDIHFPPKNESRLIIYSVFSFSYIQSPSQPYNAPPIPRPVSLFCRWSLLMGFHFPHVLCGIFLDDISTREQFAFLVYCYRVKAIFHNLCTVLYWHLCGLTNSPYLLNTFSTEADVHGAQKVISSNGFRMANCLCCLSQNAMMCLTQCHQGLQQKS